MSVRLKQQVDALTQTLRARIDQSPRLRSWFHIILGIALVGLVAGLGCWIYPDSGYGDQIIVIDPGHGGRDPGAISCLGYHEKDLNLKVAGQIAALLKQKGMHVILTRDDDRYVPLHKRADIANRSHASLLLSLHANASPNFRARGYSIHVAPSASKASMRLGQNIDQHLSQTSIRSRGVQQDPFTVLTQTHCPAILVEIGFISNPTEAALLQKAKTQKQIAHTIVRAISQSI